MTGLQYFTSPQGSWLANRYFESNPAWFFQSAYSDCKQVAHTATLSNSQTTSASGGSETRGKNANVVYLIKY